MTKIIGSPYPRYTFIMPKDIIEVILTRHSSAVPWGFTLAGGKDQGLTLKVGCVLVESVAEMCGLRSRDFIWKIGSKEVFDETHAECVKLIKSAGDRLVLTIERGDHIVPSFEEISASKTGENKNETKKVSRNMTGKAYYRDAMKDHGLSGKIPTSFSTCGKPFLENIQYNSPIEMYDDKTLMRWSKLWIPL